MTEEHCIDVPGCAYTRKVWLLDPAKGSAVDEPARHAALFLDGEFYVQHMHTPELIHTMQGGGELPAVPCLFVSHVDTVARHADLTCNESYAAFIAFDVMGWLRERFPALAEGGHLIAGPSLGGLAAAFITLKHPQVFARCLSQSGSFWWESERLMGMLDELPSSRSKFWISVGDHETQAGLTHAPSGLRQDISQITGCEHFAAALERRQHEVRYSVHPGAHETHAWAEELPRALSWLLGKC